jgi:hypothetical protein
VILLLDRALTSWSLAIDEHGEYKDLRGSSRQSVIPYAHGRTRVVFRKPTLPESAFFIRP